MGGRGRREGVGRAMSSSCVCTLHSCPAQLIWGQIQLSSATGVRPGRDLATRGAFTRKLNRRPRSSTSLRSEKSVAGLFPRRLLVAGAPVPTQVAQVRPKTGGSARPGLGERAWAQCGDGRRQ